MVGWCGYSSECEMETVLLPVWHNYKYWSSITANLPNCVYSSEWVPVVEMELSSPWIHPLTYTRTNARIFRVSDKITARRMRLAGHCQRHQELPASKLVLWEPTHGHRSRGRPTLTYVDVLKKDSEVQSTSELAGCMENRDDWKLRWKARLRTT